MGEEPQKPGYNTATIPEGVRDLVSKAIDEGEPFDPLPDDPSKAKTKDKFRPFIEHKDEHGKPVIRLGFYTKADLEAMRSLIGDELKKEERQRGFKLKDFEPFDDARRNAIANMRKRITQPRDPKEAVPITFIIEDDPRKADICFVSGNFKPGLHPDYPDRQKIPPLGIMFGEQHPKVVVMATGEYKSIDDTNIRGGDPGLKFLPYKPEDFMVGKAQYGVLFHEFGHGLGLRHIGGHGLFSNYTRGKDGSIMAYKYNNKLPGGESNPENNDLGRYDIAGLQFLYAQEVPEKARGANPSGSSPSPMTRSVPAKRSP